VWAVIGGLKVVGFWYVLCNNLGVVNRVVYAVYVQDLLAEYSNERGNIKEAQ